MVKLRQKPDDLQKINSGSEYIKNLKTDWPQKIGALFVFNNSLQTDKLVFFKILKSFSK